MLQESSYHVLNRSDNYNMPELKKELSLMQDLHLVQKSYTFIRQIHLTYLCISTMRVIRYVHKYQVRTDRFGKCIRVSLLIKINLARAQHSCQNPGSIFSQTCQRYQISIWHPGREKNYVILLKRTRSYKSIEAA